MSRYNLDAEKAKRLAEIEKMQVNGLKDQGDLCDLLIELAVKEGANGLANNLLNTRHRLLTADEASKIRANELLGKTAVAAFMAKASQAIQQEVGKLGLSTKRRNEFLDAIHAALSTVMTEGAANSEARVEQPFRDKT